MATRFIPERDSSGHLRLIETMRVARSAYETAVSKMLPCHTVESCGFLIGTEKRPIATVEAFKFVPNLSRFPNAFIIGPNELAKTARRLDSGQMVLGVFHSHHASPAPSPSDKDCMVLHSCLWLILGNLQSGREGRIVLAAFQSLRKRIIPIEVRIVGGQERSESLCDSA